MNFWKALSIFACGLGLTVSASALSFTDVDVDGKEGEPDWQYMANWNSSSGVKSWDKTFDLLGAGFDPEMMKVISATVSFAFSDDYWKKSDPLDKKNKDLEKVRILVGGETLWDDLEVDGYHSSTPLTFDWYSKSLSSNIISQLQDGIVDYSVEARYGDFYLKEASLTIEAERMSVPDTGATIAMLGLGVASLVILRRQMVKGEAA
ncbi:VPDSG-CTERM sorting domain-containing protein [Pelagicoccus mobilis]|uniref:VPDSG-CTERM sorting domain-containing protein n=1 Tax=Pelagicoccus mobilis TaxID=415221 RepID=A0A934VMV8_9BACT|nr:VPDSG-CTERM sorting domain-containing protein [Pelagicoccus mobilis]MBK1875587.1 VPDSG-CTERM sorting domain-containing protein [Pelagicoccus mobilis]